MKKKSIAILFAALLAMTACGCGATDVNVAFDGVKPWETIGYEKCTYSITRTYKPSDEVVANGEYTTEIETGPTYSEITNKFSLTYANSANANIVDTSMKKILNAGHTDTYESKAQFLKDTLIPVTASKKYTIEQRDLYEIGGTAAPLPNPQKTDLPEGIEARYLLDHAISCGDPRTYDYTVNYDENRADFTTTKAVTTKVNGKTQLDYQTVNKKITLSQDKRYDNEQLNYIVRAMSATKKNSSGTFYLTNIFDSYSNNKYVRYTMTLSCSKNLSNETVMLDASKYYMYDAEGELPKTSDGHYYVVPCVEASVSISTGQTGPSIKMWITDPSIRIIEKRHIGEGENAYWYAASKLIIKMIYTEFALQNVSNSYETTYTLSDYVQLNQQ